MIEFQLSKEFDLPGFQFLTPAGDTQPDEWIADPGFALTAGNLAEREMDMWGCILLADPEYNP